MTNFTVKIREVDPETMIFDIVGDVNIYNASVIKNEFEKQISASVKNYIMNFSQMIMIDSAGIGVLFTMMNRVKKISGAVYIVNPSKNVRKLFEATRVINFFTLLDTEDQAMQKLGKTVKA